MHEPLLNTNPYDDSPVLLVIDGRAVIGSQRTFTLEYRDRSIIITVADAERALSLLPNVAVDVLIHDRVIDDDIMGKRIKAFTRESQPNIIVVEARALGMSVDQCRKKAMRMLRGPNAAGRTAT